MKKTIRYVLKYTFFDIKDNLDNFLPFAVVVT